MTWIKRNLPFVLGSLAAVALLVVAGVYNFTRYRQNAALLEQLNTQYEELKRLNTLNPHPGSEKQDNIKAARAQEEEVRRLIGKVGQFFTPIPAIPEGTNITSEQFAAALRRTIDQLQREATNASVVIPPRYGFSFEAQRQLVRFAPGSLERLATQLGDVRLICELLHAAKINTLDGIRRERVSPDDDRGPATDYLDRTSQTNELAILTPYEVTFRCFSPELAAVLAGLGNTPHGLLLKTLNIEPATTSFTSPEMEGMPPPTVYQPVPQPITPTPSPFQRQPLGGAEEAAFAERYGLRGGPRRPYGPGGPDGPAAPPVMPAPVVAPRPVGMQTFLDEKQLKVTLLIYVVKLLPKN